MLRFDGLYVSQSHVSTTGTQLLYYRYLRFYKDGAVISVSSTGLPHEVASWFSRDNTGTSAGTYTLKNESLVFFTSLRVEDEGTIAELRVNYSGTVEEDCLKLHSRSLFNGHETVETYTFAAV